MKFSDNLYAPYILIVFFIKVLLFPPVYYDAVSTVTNASLKEKLNFKRHTRDSDEFIKTLFSFVPPQFSQAYFQMILPVKK
jgi:hypothetical protein